MERSNDRVSYSFGMKLSLPAKYESADFHVSLTSDVNPGETNDQAIKRVQTEVLKYAAEAYRQIRNSEDGLYQRATDDSLLSEATPEPTTTNVEVSKSKGTRDAKQTRSLVKRAADVLIAQKKVEAKAFKEKYLFGVKVAELSDTQAEEAFQKINQDFDNIANK